MQDDKDILIDLDADDYDDALKSLGGVAPWVDPDTIEAKPEPKVEKGRREPKPEAQAQPSVDWRAAIAERDTALAAERAARIEAQRVARDASVRSVRSDVAAVDNRYYAVENALSSAATDRSTAQTQMQAALEAGDYAKVSELQVKIAEATARISKLEDSKAEVESLAKQVQARVEEVNREPHRTDPAPAPAPVVPQTDAEKVEFYIRNNGIHPEIAKLLRDHGDLVLDPRRNAKGVAAHHLAVADGHGVGTPEYMDVFKRTLGLAEDDESGAAQPEAEDVVVEPAEAAKKRAAPRPSAPVNKTAGPGTSLKPGQIKLTPEQYQTAIEMGIDPKKYAVAHQIIDSNKGNPSYAGPRYATR